MVTYDLNPNISDVSQKLLKVLYSSTTHHILGATNAVLKQEPGLPEASAGTMAASASLSAGISVMFAALKERLAPGTNCTLTRDLTTECITLMSNRLIDHLRDHSKLDTTKPEE